jgi:hypothetical protein
MTIVHCSTLPQDLFVDIASYWDVVTLIDKKQVCRDWKQFCTNAINAKCTKTTQKAFTSNQELTSAVKKYSGFNQRSRQYSQVCSREDAEEIATTYGWPIHKWDVSNVQNFS